MKNDKLARIGLPGWGEDLATLREGELAEAAEEKLLTRYLLAIRKKFESDIQIQQIAANARPANSAKTELMKLCQSISQSGSEDIFEKAMDEILSELDHLRESNVGLTIVDTHNGQIVMPLSENMIYTPPDYIGDDGKLHKSKPILHPGISSTLGLARQETAKQEILLQKALAPGATSAYQHITEPNSICAMAAERLQQAGVRVVLELEAPEIEFEYGREQVSGIEQSPNLRFHRANMFAAVLATKILQTCGPHGTCSIGRARLKRNAKQRWHTVGVKIKSPAELESSNTE